MKKSVLSAPLRVYWDLLPEPGGLAAGRAAEIARELAELKVFFATLRFSGGARPDAAGLVRHIKGGGARVTVSSADPGSIPGPDALSLADGVDAGPGDPDALPALVKRLMGAAPAGRPFSVSLVPGKRNIGKLISAVEAALALGVRTFSLANPDLVRPEADAGDYALGEAERARLKGGLERALGPLGDEVRLFVHDLFLHGALELPGLGGRIEYAGCQAGDAIAYIGGDGILYPCASCPVPLGDLKKNTIRELWSGAGRVALREKIQAMPDGCAGCPDLADCKGGCRGLAMAVGAAGDRDPSCERTLEKERVK